MYYVDFHLHSFNSFDGKSDIDSICLSAISKNIKEICFTEHFSIDPEIPTYGYINFNRYLYEIKQCTLKYSDKLMIKKGLEICEPHLKKEELHSVIKDLNLDFIIGSVHNINKQKLRSYIKDKNNYEAYNGYFQEIYNLVCSADIDIIGHLDLLKRYAFKELGNYNFNEHENLIVKILEKAIERNIGLEINTSGIRSSVNEIFPSIEVLNLYKKLGGKIITIGSDSHDDKLVGEGFQFAIDVLKSCGFKYMYTFENKRYKKHRIY